MKRIAELPTELYETSGLVFYNNEFIITHNDGGNESEIFLLDLAGNLKKTIKINDAKNHDWEDLTIDDENRIYIGDFGNNNNNRENLAIYILPKNLQDKNEVDAKKIKFTYEDQEKFPPSKQLLNFDCEAFFWKDDSLYLFTKCRTEPFTGISTVYVLPAKEGTYKARRIGSVQLCSSDWRFCSVTAADYSEKYKTLILLTYSKIYLIKNFEENRFWEGSIKSYQLSLVRQREAICFKGKNAWYLTDEYRKGLGGGNLYELTLK